MRRTRRGSLFWLRGLGVTSATSALILIFLTATPAFAGCAGAVADGARLWRAATSATPVVSLTLLGHASFLIESPQGVRIVTDYNDLIGSPVTPDIVTMNNAHGTHYSDRVEPGVKQVLRGWDPAGGMAHHNIEYRDVKVSNVPTNVREGLGTRYNGNSIFEFDTAELCIAHLGHLHHTLSDTHLAELGAIDVVLVPVDGAWTLNQEDMFTVLEQIKPRIAIPMHIFTQATLDRFLARAAEHFRVRRVADPTIRLTRAELPNPPEVIVLPGR